ncbi:hypothetical protein L2E82_26943 [Cichorium intybus]|uniref:Uncharacterized protein n=1 Tax=Cichorium intybus TaxID=13427 RepID=A0ACB9CRZ6_CICIN|nr:hypothetical protein L2E82_26943 [Cichorium intybus]
MDRNLGCPFSSLDSPLLKHLSLILPNVGLDPFVIFHSAITFFPAAHFLPSVVPPCLGISVFFIPPPTLNYSCNVLRYCTKNEERGCRRRWHSPFADSIMVIGLLHNLKPLHSKPSLSNVLIHLQRTKNLSWFFLELSVLSISSSQDTRGSNITGNENCVSISSLPATLHTCSLFVCKFYVLFRLFS